jgi:CheY-like chemotaxis protein
MERASRILVVDDEPVFADNLRSFLSRDCPDVRVALDAQEALRTAEAFAPDLVLMDCRLGNSDGIAVLDRIRAGRRQHCRALLMTAHPSQDVLEAADAIGVSTVLSKPFSFAELRDAMRSSQVPSELPQQAKDRRKADRRHCELPSSAPARFFDGLMARLERRRNGGRRSTDS